VVRKQSKEDRRAVDVFISEKGLNLLNELDQQLSDWEKQHNQFKEEDLRWVNNFLDQYRQNGNLNGNGQHI